MLIADGFFSLPLHRHMKEIVYHYGDNLTQEGHYAVTIGFFDGVHMGHRFLIRQLQELAEQRGLKTMVVTFENHPRRVLHSEWQPQLLTSLEEKKKMIEETGVDALAILKFDQQMAQLSAREFMGEVLGKQLNAQLLLTGYDNRFGHDRTETFDDYVGYGKQLGIEVTVGKPYSYDNNNDEPHRNVSSSLVRKLIGEGKMEEAAHCLGRPYELTGKVVHGEQVGRKLGFPTANIEIDDNDRLIPPSGVYAVTVTENSMREKGNRKTALCYHGMMNIGTRPTFDGQRQTLEVNIFDFDKDIYGQRITIGFACRLRNEQFFDSPQLLAAQMEKDAKEAKEYLNGQTDISLSI